MRRQDSAAEGQPRRCAAASEATHTTFGALLRRYRLAAGLTQQTLAERAGISARGVQVLEQGKTRPQRKTAQRLAAALPISRAERAGFAAAAQPAPRRRGAADAAPSPAAAGARDVASLVQPAGLPPGGPAPGDAA